MTMTREAKRLHEEYEQSNPIIKSAVDAAYTAARKELQERGLDVSNTDPAEELVAAIFKYVLDSATPTVPHQDKDALDGIAPLEEECPHIDYDWMPSTVGGDDDVLCCTECGRLKWTAEEIARQDHLVAKAKEYQEGPNGLPMSADSLDPEG